MKNKGETFWLSTCGTPPVAARGPGDGVWGAAAFGLQRGRAGTVRLRAAPAAHQPGHRRPLRPPHSAASIPPG